MAVLVILNNPFDLSDREIKTIELAAPEALRSILAQHVPLSEDMEYHVSLDGKIVGPEELDEFTVTPESYVAVCPVLRGGGNGKNPLSILAGVVLSVFSFGLGNMVAGATGALWAGNLATGLTLMAGGQLIGNALGATVNQDDDSESHKWGSLQSITSQGAVIPMTYGKIRTAGQILGQHIRTDGDTQYLEILLSGGEGPIDSYTNIKINDNDADNYSDVTIETRPGDNDQTVITGFNNIYVDQFLSYSLESGKDGSGEVQQDLPGEWSIHETDTDAAEGLQIEFTFTAGLYDMGNQGNTGERDVVIDVEYAVAGGSWIAWDGIGRIKKNTQKPFAMVFCKENIQPGKYQVRARVSQRRGSKERGADMVVWSRLVSVIYQPLCHPNKGLVGVTIKATGQLSGNMPTITWEQERKNVLVKSPSGAWAEKSARNPAWIVYDMCVRARRLSGEVVVFGEDPGRMDYPAFEAWAAYCDRRVGGQKAIEMNLLVDSSKTIWDWCQDVASSARAAILLRGLKISCIFDAAGDPVQLFSSGNIVLDSFRGEYLQLDNRANSVEISFNNEAKNYEREQVSIYSPGFGEGRATANPVSVSLVGITDFARAYREGMYRLYQNQYILRTITFTTDIDSIACQVGDIVLIQHDATQWGQGGRILEVSGSTLTLDTRIKKPTGTARITIRKQGDDSLHEGTVSFTGVANEYGYDKIIAGGISGVRPGDVFAIGSATQTAKPFRIYEISRDSDLRATITATEYAEEVYNDNIDIPDVASNGSGVIMDTNRIVNLRIVPNGEYQGATWIVHLWATWTYAGEHPIAYEVEYKYDDDPWVPLGKPVQTTIECPYRDAKTTYYVRVRALYTQSPPSAWEYASTVGMEIGDGTPPDPPTDLIAQGLNGFALLTWTNPENPDLHHIEIWVSSTDNIEDAVLTGQTPADTYSWPQPLGGEFWFWVRAVNNTGQKSDYNAEAGTYCKIEPEGWRVLIDELLKDELIQQILEWFREPIGEIESIGDRASEQIIKNILGDYRDVYKQMLIDRAAAQQAENEATGVISDYEEQKYSLALVVDEASIREEADIAQARKTDGVIAMIGDPENPGPDTVYAAVMDTKEAVAELDSATATRIQELNAVIGDPENPTPESVYGAIRTEEQVRATADEAAAARADIIASMVGDPADPQPGTAFGAILSEAETRATADDAAAERTEQIQAQLNTDIGAVRASILSEQTARVSADSAISSTVSTVQSQLNGNIASVQTLSSAVNGISTQWGVKLDVNGYVSGLSTMNNGKTSSMVFLTDTFMIGRPGYATEPAFAIGTVGGVYRVIMRDAFIQDLSVTTLKIAGNAVTVPQYYKGYPGSSSGTFSGSSVTMSGLNPGQPIICLLKATYSGPNTSRIQMRAGSNTVISIADPYYISGGGGDRKVGIGIGSYQTSSTSVTFSLAAYNGTINCEEFEMIMLHVKK